MLPDFNDFWHTASWRNLTLVDCKFAHLTWENVTQYLAKNKVVHKLPPCAWTHAPSRFHHWSMASSMTLCCSPAHVSTSHCWKTTFFTFPRYSSYSMRVRWANLQPSNVKFLQDSLCQKLLKSVHFWRSYSKNKNVSVFWDTVYKCWTKNCKVTEVSPQHFTNI